MISSEDESNIDESIIRNLKNQLKNLKEYICDIKEELKLDFVKSKDSNHKYEKRESTISNIDHKYDKLNSELRNLMSRNKH